MSLRLAQRVPTVASDRRPGSPVETRSACDGRRRRSALKHRERKQNRPARNLRQPQPAERRLRVSVPYGVAHRREAACDASEQPSPIAAARGPSPRNRISVQRPTRARRPQLVASSVTRIDSAWRARSRSRLPGGCRRVHVAESEMVSSDRRNQRGILENQ